MQARRAGMADLAHIATWLAARELDLSMVDDLPELGWVIEHQGEAICAGYLRRVEGDGYAIFDSIISNPEQKPAVRHEALDLLYKTVIDEAASLMIKHIIGFTNDANTRKRSIKHGFTALDHTLLILNRTTDQG